MADHLLKERIAPIGANSFLIEYRISPVLKGLFQAGKQTGSHKVVSLCKNDGKHRRVCSSKNISENPIPFSKSLVYCIGRLNATECDGIHFHVNLAIFSSPGRSPGRAIVLPSALTTALALANILTLKFFM